MIREKPVSNIILIFEKIEKSRWGMLVAVAFPIFILLFPVLFSWAVFSQGFSYSWVEQGFYFYKDALAREDSVLWNPLVFSGFPSFISLTGGFFSPLAYIFFKFLPVTSAYGWLIFFHLVFGGFCTALFLKKIKVSFIGAYVGALSFIMSQWLLSSDLTLVGGIAYLPLLFLILLEVSRKKSYWLLFLGSAAIALGWFSVHWHLFVETLFAAGIFSLYLAFFGSDNEDGAWRFRLRSWRPPLYYATMVFFGSIMGLMQLIPTYFYIGLSNRAEGFSHWGASGGGTMPGDFITFFLPHFNVPSFNSSPWIYYVGILPLFFFFYSVSFRYSAWAGLFSFLTVFSYLLSMERSPLFWLMHHLPFFNLLHSPGRWIFITDFSISILAALGYEKLINGIFSEKRAKIQLKILKYVFILFFFASSLFSAVVYFFEGGARSFLKFAFLELFYKGKTLPAEFFFPYIDKMFFYLKGSFYFFDPRIFFAIVFILLGYLILERFRHGAISVAFFSYAVLFAVFLNFIAVFLFSGLTVSSSALPDLPKTAEIIKKHSAGRILPIFGRFALLPDDYSYMPLSSGEQLFFSSAMLEPNINTRYGIPSAEYFDELASRRMARILGLFRSITPADKDKILLMKPILNFIGARFILSPYEIKETGSFNKIFTETFSFTSVPVFVYENLDARPLFYFASSVETIPEDEEAAFEKLKMIPEEGLGVFVECQETECGSLFKSRHCEEQGDEAISFEQKRDCFASLAMTKNSISAIEVNGQGVIEVKTKKNTVSILKTKSETPQFLVFSENHLPGWKAYIDGVEAPIYTVGSVYMGVVVPEGGHEVKFEFTYRTIIEEFFKMIKHKF